MDHQRDTVDDRRRIDRRHRPPLIDKRVGKGGPQRGSEDADRASDEND